MSDDIKKCKPMNHPNLVDGWVCCQCPTFNGNQRDDCKWCGHTRCDNPAVKRIPIMDEGGVHLVPINATPVPDKDKLN
jgi:hypothetical protein